LIDDLVTRGTNEPYRMFTSRAEYRLLLREDNADLRLTPIAHELGLIDETIWQRFSEKRAAIVRETQRLQDTLIHPQTEIANKLASKLEAPLTRPYRMLELLRRPNLNYQDFITLMSDAAETLDPKVIEQIEIQAKYAGYIDRQTEEIARLQRQENCKIPATLNYSEVRGLSTEVQQLLNKQCPATLGMAARIPGVTPAAISLLLVHLKRHQRAKDVTESS